MKKILLSALFMSIISMTAFAGDGGGGGAVADEQGVGLYPGTVRFITQQLYGEDWSAWVYADLDLSNIATEEELCEALRDAEFITPLREPFSFSPNFVFQFSKLVPNAEDELINGDWSDLYTFPSRGIHRHVSNPLLRRFAADLPIVKISEGFPPQQEEAFKYLPVQEDSVDEYLSDESSSEG